MKSSKEYNKDLGTGLKLLVKSSLIVFVFLFLSKLLFYIYRLIIARSFGPEVYGLFSLALIILLWFVSLSSLGFDQGLLRFISLYRGKKQNENIRYLSRFTIRILLFLSIFAGFLLFFLSDIIAIQVFHNENLTFFLKVFSFTIPLYIFANLFLAILRAYEKIVWYSFIMNVFQNIIKVSSIIILILVGFSANAVVFSYFLGIFGMFALAFYVLKKSIPGAFKPSSLRKDVKIRLTKNFFSYSWPIMFLGILNSIFYFIDSLTIGFFKNAVEVGLYNAAVPIAALMGFAPELFMQLFFPLITKEFSRKNFHLIKDLSQQVGKWIFILNLPFLIIMFFFPGAIINLLFGEEYLAAATALRILSVGFFFATLSISIPLNLLSTMGKSKLLLINLLVVSIFNLVLNIILVPRYGINGAAFSTLLANIIFGSILLIQVRHFSSIIPLRKKAIRIFIVSLIPTLLLLYLKTVIPISFVSLILLGSLFLFSYILLIFIFGCLDRNDFLIIKSIKDKYFNR